MLTTVLEHPQSHIDASPAKYCAGSFATGTEYRPEISKSNVPGNVKRIARKS